MHGRRRTCERLHKHRQAVDSNQSIDDIVKNMSRDDLAALLKRPGSAIQVHSMPTQCTFVCVCTPITASLTHMQHDCPYWSM